MDVKYLDCLEVRLGDQGSQASPGDHEYLKHVNWEHLNLELQGAYDMSWTIDGSHPCSGRAT